MVCRFEDVCREFLIIAVDMDMQSDAQTTYVSRSYFSAKAVNCVVESAVAEKLYACQPQPLLRNATPAALEGDWLVLLVHYLLLGDEHSLRFNKYKGLVIRQDTRLLFRR